MKILIVEDEPKLITFLRKGLEEFGHEVTVATDGETGELFALSKTFDALIIDINLPKQNGFDLLRNIRAKEVHTPAIILTAMSSLSDKEEGFEAGADDYLVKPFEFKELILRLKNITKRHSGETGSRILKLGTLTLDLNLKRAKRNDREIPLTNKEFELLKYLFLNKSRVISRAELAENVWEQRFDTGTNTIDVYINFLRKKIDNGTEKKLLHTVVGMGYLFREEKDLP